MNSFPVWSVSLHHALGGKPLWLVVCGHRNGPEAQSQATLAGHRLTRVLGGFSGHLALDARWQAYYLRVNEVVVVATYTVASDGSEAMAAAGAARGALLDVCGRPSDVTLAALWRCGAEVQLALRRAVSGFGRLGVPIGTPKFDLAAVQLSPEAPPDDAASVAMRAANDVTSQGAAAGASDAWLHACSRAAALGEALPRALRPSAAAQGAAAPPRGTWLDSPAAAASGALQAYLACRGAQRPQQRRSLLPRSLTQAVLAAEARAAAHAGARGGGGEGLLGSAAAAGSGEARGVGPEDLWASVLGSSEEGGGGGGSSGARRAGGSSASASSGSGASSSGLLTLSEADAFAPPALPEFTVTLRVAAQCAETATLTAAPGEAAVSSGTLAATCQLRYMYGNALPAEVEESGHGALRFVLHFSPGGPLEALTYTPPAGAAGAPVDLLQHSGSSAGSGAGAAAVHAVTLTLPARPPGLRTYAPGELGALAYRFAPSHALPPLLTAAASARAAYGADGLHRHTDLLLRTCLDASRAHLAATQVQFLVALPPLPPAPAPSAAPVAAPAAAAASPAYAPPVCVPLAQWSQPRAQLLWALTEGSAAPAPAPAPAEGAAPAPAPAAAPALALYFAPGKLQQFRARVPVSDGGAAAPGTGAAGPPVSLAVHARFSFTNGLVAPVALSATAPGAGAGRAGKGGAQQPLNADTEASGMGLRVEVIGLMVKCSSSVRCLFKA